jgi:hypothetical protein
MKILLVLCILSTTLGLKAQESFRIEKVPKTFHWSFTRTFDKKLNDTISLYIEPEGSNYQVSIRRNDGSISCSCLFELNKTDEMLKYRIMTHSGSNGPAIKDSTVQIKILKQVNGNCLEKYRLAIAKSQ